MHKGLWCALPIAFALVVSPAQSQTQSQSWPQKPVKMIVPQAAGNSPDLLCRIVTDRLAKSLGQAFIVENRAGTANIIGMQAAAHSAPDGYTFVFATSAALVANPYTFTKLPYDTVNDFAPVSTIAKSNHIVLVHPDVPAKTLPELIALEKASPGKLNMAVDGPRNFSGILGRYINKFAGTDFNLVPYNQISQAVQDSIAGRTEVTIQSASVVEPHIKRGSLRPVAVAGTRRMASLPDVPAIAETLPAVELQGWFMIMAPAKTSATVIKKLSDEISLVLKDPEIQERALKLGFEIDPATEATPENAKAFLNSELALWGKAIKELGIEPE
jgi:tripartite-type tricarboxylate transporter receptor subunit TctC